MDSNIIVALLVGLLFLITGVQLFRGKWLFLVAGYNTMSKENKDKINGKFVGKVTGTMLLLSCLIIGMMLIYPAAQTVCFILQLVIVITGIIYVNVSNKRNINWNAIFVKNRYRQILNKIISKRTLLMCNQWQCFKALSNFWRVSFFIWLRTIFNGCLISYYLGI